MEAVQKGTQIHILDDNITIRSVVESIINTADHEDPGPFMVCDLGDVIDQHNMWANAMPNIMPFYAVKCNDSIPILKTLAALGTGFDCASLVII